MTYPIRPARSYSYTAFSQSQGNNAFPGTFLDDDLDSLDTALDEVIGYIEHAFTADGSLGPGTVTKQSLAADILLGLRPPRPWVTATVFAVDDTVTNASNLYRCAVAHTAGATFTDDLAAGRWQLLATFTTSGTPSDLSVTTAKIVDTAVTNPKLATDSVDGRVLAAGAVGAAELASTVGTVPIGAEMFFAGLAPPSKWLFEYGQAVSRTTYSDLFAVLTSVFTASTTLNNPTLSSVNVDLRGLGLEGVKIEGPNLPIGATIVSIAATSITLSANATAAASGQSFRVFPHGNGDGVNTFNVPDWRGRGGVGRDDLGGTAATRLGLLGADGAKLGKGIGSDRTTLTSANLPPHAHTFTGTPVGDHTHSYSAPTGTTGAGAGPGQAILSTTVANVNGGGAHTPAGTIGNGPGTSTPFSTAAPGLVRNVIIFAGV